jgi:PAS domain S-box-containing protein
MNGKREMIKELTNSALSILSKYENDEKLGILTREKAQETAISRIRYLRYGDENKDYFWITDLLPVMIMHPYKPTLNGKDLSNFKDPHGKRLFVEFVNTVKRSNYGYVDYMWQWKDDSTHIVPKLSYVSIFKPWGWVIGTGIYIEDVKKEISRLTNKLVWISVGISIIIAMLLFFITEQSLKIENKRREAETELHSSKEKYKTLVEAATEGLIMLIDGKISFINSITSMITGFESQEVVGNSLSQILDPGNPAETLSIFSQTIVKDGQYVLYLKKQGGGFTEVHATSSTAKLLDQSVNIIMLKELAKDQLTNISSLEYQKLISTLHIGFVKINLDGKGKFLFANNIAIDILGFKTFRDLAETYFYDLIDNTEDRKALKNNLSKHGFVRNFRLGIQKPDGKRATVSITIIIIDNSENNTFICDGIIEDITSAEFERKENLQLISELKSNSFLLEQPVKDYLSPIQRIDAERTIKEALDVFSGHNTDCILVTKNHGDILGLLSGSDIQKRVFNLNLNLENPVYLIMSSPVYYINEYTSVSESLQLCDKYDMQHLVVKNNINQPTGIFSLDEILHLLKDSQFFLLKAVESAKSSEDLKTCYHKLQILISPLIQSEISVRHITGITSAFSDSVTKRALEMAIKELGEPPAKFSFVAMGSEGRKEETLLTDQDNAIIYEDVSKEKEAIVKSYFLLLGEYICSVLNHAGYSYCIGNIMAKNEQWCQPVSVWQKYFTGWISSPEPQNLLDATIFFDFRTICGDPEPANKLKNSTNMLIKEYPSFLYHLANNTFTLKPPQIFSVNTLTEKNADVIDLKNAVSFFTMFVRAYSLQNNIDACNTLERLMTLKSLQIVNQSAFDEISYAYNFLMKLRFRNQAEYAENKLPLSNILSVKKLIDIELTILKKVLAVIPVYQSKIGNDFRIST